MKLAIVTVLLFAVVGAGGYFAFVRTPRPAAVVPTEFKDTNTGLPTAEEFARLAATDPVAMLDASLTRYARDVTSFRATLEKQERLKGTLHPPEIMKVAVQEKPVKVSMRWVSGARPFLGVRTTGVAFVEGADDAHMRSWQPDAPSFLRKDKVDTKGFFARDASRYCIKDAGFLPTMLRTREAWGERQKAGELKFVYHGLRPIDKLGNRPCHVIERTCPHRELDSFSRDEATSTDPKLVERDGFDTVTIYIDADTWIQTGSELKRANGDIVGTYFFRDLELNPKLTDEEFTLEGLKRAP